MADIKLLDCTLRDGGYVNDWQWGFGSARRIIQTLTRAGVDVVEVGFLRNVDGYDPDVTVCNTIEELNRLLPDEGQRGHTMYSGMAMRSNYDIAKLSPYDGHGIEIIRITAHDYDIKDGMDFARRIKELGYKVSINPINIMGYSDKDLLWIFEQVNEIHPWQFSIVDTFGSMRRRDLERIVSLVDHNLAPDIRLALHLHENMALSFCLAQEFLDKHLRRDLAVDGSLMGMGRIPGNLPIELIADYMNEYFGGHYNIDDLMDAIQDYIAPIKGECAWGYTPAYFLSAKFNLHRNYAEHYLGKGDLTNRDINHILAAIAPDKKTVFDAAYADTLYVEYKNRRTDDTAALTALQAAFTGKTVRVLAPGASLATEAGRAAVAAAQADIALVRAEHDLLAPAYDAAAAVQARVVRRLAAAPADGLDLLDGIRAGQQAGAAGEEIAHEVRPQTVADHRHAVFVHDARQQVHLLRREELRLVHDQAIVGVRAHGVEVERVKQRTLGRKPAARADGGYAVARIGRRLEQQGPLAALVIIVPDHDGVGRLARAHRAITEIQLRHIQPPGAGGPAGFLRTL